MSSPSAQESPTIQRALISVYDKTGIVDFARVLVDEFGIEILSTGGTATMLRENGVPVTLVEEVTGCGEMLDGRVKTLHPKIHAAILADRDNADHMRQLSEAGVEPIDMVIVNLYPFCETVARADCTDAEAIEMIDIGGPCMLRAAAKNHKHVLVVNDPDCYAEVSDALRKSVEAPDVLDKLRPRYAADTFSEISVYDSTVAEWMSIPGTAEGWPAYSAMFASNWGPLRYGENPHQTADLLQTWDETELDLTVADEPGSEADVQSRMSFNNYLDANSALQLCAELTRGRVGANGALPVCCFIKHTNACGVGVGGETVEAYRRAYLGDPNAAMGGILSVSFPVDAEFAETVMETFQRFGKPLADSGHAAAPGAFFVEVWVAPAFDEDAVKIIRTRKKWGERLRLLAMGDMSAAPDPNEIDFKRIAGGFVSQTRDLIGLEENEWTVVSKRAPTDTELADLRLAWLICKHTKSNAITLCKDNMLIGNGAGQMSRVMSCRIATWLAKENGHADALNGSAAASDAFFPFRDGPGLLIDAGVTAVIQPGGSKRDGETIQACDERGVAMIFTHTRHFRH